jgi:hypothetical protein
MLAAGTCQYMTLAVETARWGGTMSAETRKDYEAPTVNDYGSLLEITAASGFSGPEDGGNKLSIHHTQPASP